MAGLEDLLGAGDALKQLMLWTVFSEVVNACINPYLTLLTQRVNEATPVQPLSPPDAATAVNRSFLSESDGEAFAAKSGINPAVFAVMRDLAGDAPAPEQLVEMLRRKIIAEDGTGPDSTSFQQGISETNLLDKWTDQMKALALQWPTPADALRAALQGQVPQDQGKVLYQQWGGDPQWYDIMFDSEGSAPTPLEASEMALRGIIPWDGTGPAAVTYQQAFLEGPWRNKWQDAYQALSTYVPTATQVADFLRYGAVTEPQALAMMAQTGVTGDVAAAFIARARTEAITEYSGLTISSVLELYYDQLIDTAQVTGLLEQMNISAQNAELLAAQTDLRREIQVLQTAVSRVGTLYIGHKITESTASNALTQLEIPQSQIPEILSRWAVEAQANVKTLTEAQIADALEYEILTGEQAVTELVNLGYTPYDAWLILSVKMKTPLPDKPPGPPPSHDPGVSPGTT